MWRSVPATVSQRAPLAQSVYPFLKPAFGKGGLLEAKEVYAFSPSTLTVVEGETIHFTFINPEDDNHSFVLPDVAIDLRGWKATQARYVATHAGVYPIVWAVQAHLPMMSGELIVLSPSAIVGANTASTD